MFRPGTSEVVAGRVDRRAASRARALGETLRFASRDWTVVGVFDAGRTGFDSEIWGDAEQMLQAFRRTGFSSLLFRLDRRRPLRRGQARDRDRSAAHARGEARARASTPTSRRRCRSSSATSALTISVIFSIGAIIGAMITMYASVASRTGEIGTLRALGFSRGAILVAFLVEALLLGLRRRRRRARRARRSCRRSRSRR